MTPPVQTSAADIRQTFVDYFVKRDHQHIASSPLPPQNDPTLLFTNAGMVQFKNVFTGQESRPYDKAVTVQKCLRAGGKHNDLDNVGYTYRHHTFFEMMGNFAFGAYFKERAIRDSWELVTRYYDLPADRLWITVYHEDDTAYDLWRDIAGVPESRIIRIPTKDNFWAMGDTGPCGPCSEIFYDHGAHVPGGPPGSADEDGDRFIEIWNLVFMEFEQIDAETRINLPNPSIDTGMGLERIAAVINGTNDNYATDLFQPLLEESIRAAGGCAADESKPGHRVIADHMRAAAFLIADGVVPANEGRGYVLRRIMRRAMRHGFLFGIEEPFMGNLLAPLVATMGGVYPELGRAEALIRETVRLEEIRFFDLLGRGLRLLDEAITKVGSQAIFPGEVAFRLYDTYGFPLDLTEDALRERGMKVDRAGFEKAMNLQREEARRAWRGSGSVAVEALWFPLLERSGGIDFVGYEADHATAPATALIAEDREMESLADGMEGALMVPVTPFYGAGGGQLGDQGMISNESGGVFEVSDTTKPLDGLIIHHGRMIAGSISLGDRLDLRIDGSRRAALRRAHSATHLLHAALRDILGAHVTQKGSLVAADRLRFDFSHAKAMTTVEMEAVEEAVNEQIMLNEAVFVRVMSLQDAINAGALALFGEKYSDEVRVLAMGRNLQAGADYYSTELCGGTHVERTGDIALVSLINETGIASGVRRLEALTGAAARRTLRNHTMLMRSVSDRLRVVPEKAVEQIDTLLDERKNLTREVGTLRSKLAFAGDRDATHDGLDDVVTIGAVRVLARRAQADDAATLRRMIDEGKKRLGSGIIALISARPGGKAMLAVGVTSDLTGRYNAIDLVRAGSVRLGGKGGGGRPDMALAGGADGDNAAAALVAITDAVAAVEDSPAAIDRA